MGKPWAAYHFEALAQNWTLNFSQQFRVFTFNFHGSLSHFFHIHLGKLKLAMEKKLTCIFLELREDLIACWQVTRRKTQPVAHLSQHVAPLWCVAPE